MNMYYLIAIIWFFFSGWLIALLKNRLLSKNYKDELAKTVHGLRTPLTRVRWMLDEIKESPIDHIELIAKSKTTINDLIKIINDTLDDSALQGKKEPVKFTKINLADLLEKIKDEYDFVAEKKGISFAFKKPGYPTDLMTDIESTSMAIKNILDNSFQYTPGGGKIELELSKVDSFYQIKVQDNGIGVPIKDQPNLTKKFFRAENAKSYADGSGLGLYISKEIINRDKGKMTIESTQNNGTTVKILFPING